MSHKTLCGNTNCVDGPVYLGLLTPILDDYLVGYRILVIQVPHSSSLGPPKKNSVAAMVDT